MFQWIDWRMAHVVDLVRWRDKCCQLCSRPYRANWSRRFNAHHIDQKSLPGAKYDLENLVLLCHGCHVWVHSKDNVDGLFLGEGHTKRRSRHARSASL